MMGDKYKVSLDGTVFSFHRDLGGKALKPSLDGKGYKQVVLSEGGSVRTRKVHRLVAECFIPNPNNLPQVNHIDEDKLNNHADNLEWCDCQYNNEYSKAKHYKFIDPAGKVIELFNLCKFSRENSLGQGHMVAVALGKRPHHKGWRKYG